MGSLPFGIAVEIDMVVEVADPEILFLGAPKLLASAHQDFSGLINSNQPARAGEIIHLYGSGFGPVTPSVPDGAPAPAAAVSRTTNPITCRVWTPVYLDQSSSLAAPAGTLPPGALKRLNVNQAW